MKLFQLNTLHLIWIDTRLLLSIFLMQSLVGCEICQELKLKMGSGWVFNVWRTWIVCFCRCHLVQLEAWMILSWFGFWAICQWPGTTMFFLLFKNIFTIKFRGIQWIFTTVLSDMNAFNEKKFDTYECKLLVQHYNNPLSITNEYKLFCFQSSKLA